MQRFLLHTAWVELAAFLLVGFLGGLHRACWGGYKDSPFEPYKLSKTIRSLIVGIGWGGALFYLLPYFGVGQVSMVNIYFMAIGLDTITTEFYKLFFRTESQAIYAIPSHFHLWNKKVTNNFVRAGIGITFSALLVGIFLWLVRMPTTLLGPVWLTAAVIGLVGGFMEAIGGMWKDAPFESFEPVKFFRSPTVGLIVGLLLSLITTNMAVLLFSVFGADRSVIEFYKGFMKGMKSGKFRAEKEKPTFPEWARKRTIFIAPYLLTWVFVLGALVLGK